jgi:hypothetical protein
MTPEQRAAIERERARREEVIKAWSKMPETKAAK